MVNEWPAVLGSDFAAVVIELGEGCTRLDKDDYVFGCSLIGQNKYTPFQDTFLVDEDLVFKKGDDVSLETASATAVGLLVRLDTTRLISL
ncbi:hypothetical protein IMZ48_07450, partial [Candidatus Bathyarchaeota archaeon]|nr:hypothetical protein [Candidatus Bathyarchaeota archaeon]